jgi:hypothetical protein
MVASLSPWIWWLGQALALGVSVVVALVLTRQVRRAQTDRVGLVGSIAIAIAGAAVGAWVMGLGWWWAADLAAFFATFSFRLFARPLR